MPDAAKIFRDRAKVVVVLSLILAVAGCATTAPQSPASLPPLPMVTAPAPRAAPAAAREPVNLTTLKNEVVRYVESGEHQRDIAAVAAQAQAWIEARAQRKAGNERLAMVFDIDETLLFNWEEMKGMDFGYYPPIWDAWIAEARAPVIEPVREAYRAARRLGIDVVFITGRRASQREATARNLASVGCGEYFALLCKPDTPKQPTGPFKLAERKRLAAEGFTIIASIGDQESDFFGGGAERTFKLPAPFYITE